jgi:Glycine transporter
MPPSWSPAEEGGQRHAVVARRSGPRGLDIVGVIALGMITALGGGIIRDILLDDLPPATFQDWRYLAVAAGGAFIAFLLGHRLHRLAGSPRSSRPRRASSSGCLACISASPEPPGAAGRHPDSQEQE